MVARDKRKVRPIEMVRFERAAAYFELGRSHGSNLRLTIGRLSCSYNFVIATGPLQSVAISILFAFVQVRFVPHWSLVSSISGMSRTVIKKRNTAPS